jgi:YHS domain-containing protein
MPALAPASASKSNASKPAEATAALAQGDSVNDKVPDIADPALNSVCPVSGEAVDTAVTETFEGKLIAFCCEKCRDWFRANPAKFPLRTAAVR